MGSHKSKEDALEEGRVIWARKQKERRDREDKAVAAALAKRRRR